MEQYARSLGGRRRARGSRGRIARPTKHYLTLERLERRDLLTVLLWIGGDGDFGDPSHWTGGALGEVPGLGDTALFSGGNHAVTISDGQQVSQLKIEAGANVTFTGSGLFKATEASLTSASLIVQGDVETLVEVTTTLTMTAQANLTVKDGALVLVGENLDLDLEAGDNGKVTAETGVIFVGVKAAEYLDELKAPGLLGAKIGSLAYIAARNIHVAYRSGEIPINQATGIFSTDTIEAGYLEGGRVDTLVLATRTTETLVNGFFSQGFLGDATLSYDASTGKLRLDVPVNFSGTIYPAFPDLSYFVRFRATGQIVAVADVGLPGQALDFTTLDNQFDFVVDPQQTTLDFEITGSAPGLIGDFTAEEQEPGSLTARFGGKLVADFTPRNATESATIRFLDTSVIDGIEHATPLLPGPVLGTNGVQILPQGTLSGRGQIIGNVVNDGLVRVKISTGLELDAFSTLRIHGNFTQSSLGTLQVDVTPSYYSIGFGLTVSGTAQLDHRLRFNLQGDFSSRTDNFVVVGAIRGLSGTFSEVQGNRVGATYFNVDYLFDQNAVVVRPQQAGLIVETTPNFFTDESGKVATFGVKLTSAPTAPVTVQLGTSDSSEGSATNATGGKHTGVYRRQLEPTADGHRHRRRRSGGRRRYLVLRQFARRQHRSRILGPDRRPPTIGQPR